MKAKNRTPQPDKNGKIRTTISVDQDLHPEFSEQVRQRMRMRRASSYSNYVEVIMAEDCGLKNREVVPA